jgi:integral membrane protein
MKTFITIGWLETVSYLCLLFIAMPLKYIWHLDAAVKYNGWIHGVLFVAYVFALINLSLKNKWSFKLFTFGFIASLLPFGPVYFDKKYLVK